MKQVAGISAALARAKAPGMPCPRSEPGLRHRCDHRASQRHPLSLSQHGSLACPNARSHAGVSWVAADAAHASTLAANIQAPGRDIRDIAILVQRPGQVAKPERTVQNPSRTAQPNLESGRMGRAMPPSTSEQSGIAAIVRVPAGSD